MAKKKVVEIEKAVEEIVEKSVEKAVEIKKSIKGEDDKWPRWRYHKEKDALIVHSDEQNKALGAGWADSPAEFEEK